MRRAAPRPIAAALEGYTREAAPATLLARVQAQWPEVAGDAIAAEAEPTSERAGTITFSCSSGVWANELDLLSPDLLGRLNAALADESGGPVKALRFRVL
jgi:predicted nucleic acid-binding Zn ribbon protein